MVYSIAALLMFSIAQQLMHPTSAKQPFFVGVNLPRVFRVMAAVLHSLLAAAFVPGRIHCWFDLALSDKASRPLLSTATLPPPLRPSACFLASRPGKLHFQHFCLCKKYLCTTLHTQPECVCVRVCLCLEARAMPTLCAQHLPRQQGHKARQRQRQRRRQRRVVVREGVQWGGGVHVFCMLCCIMQRKHD